MCNRRLSRQNAIEQKLQHLSITGFRQFDRFAHERDFFALEEGFGD